MAKIYGIYVGTPKQASPFTPVDDCYERSYDEIIVRDTIVLNTTVNGTIIQAARDVGWDTVLDPGCKFYNDALGAAVTLSFGVAGFTTALDNAVDVHLATAIGGVGLLSAISFGNYYQPLWQMVGYASLAAAQLVSPQAELIFTLGGANTAAANRSLTWKLIGARRK